VRALQTSADNFPAAFIQQSLQAEGVEVQLAGHDIVSDALALREDDVLVITDSMSRSTCLLAGAARRMRARMLYAPNGFPVWDHRSGGLWDRARFAVVQRRLLEWADVTLVASRLEHDQVTRLGGNARLFLPIPSVPVVEDAGGGATSPCSVPEKYVHWPLGQSSWVRAAVSACRALDVELVVTGQSADVLRHKDSSRRVHAFHVTRAGEAAIAARALWLLDASKYTRGSSESLALATSLGVPWVSGETGNALDLSSHTRCPVYLTQDRRDEAEVVQGIVWAAQHLARGRTPPVDLRAMAKRLGAEAARVVLDAAHGRPAAAPNEAIESPVVILPSPYFQYAQRRRLPS
jgi:hypothetical protein